MWQKNTTGVLTRYRSGYSVSTMKLDEWITSNPKSLEDPENEMAAALKCHPKSIYKYKRGIRIPEPDAMRFIYTFTDGLVDPNSFFNLPEIKLGKVSTRREARTRRTG